MKAATEEAVVSILHVLGQVKEDALVKSSLLWSWGAQHSLFHETDPEQRLAKLSLDLRENIQQSVSTLKLQQSALRTIEK